MILGQSLANKLKIKLAGYGILTFIDEYVRVFKKSNEVGQIWLGLFPLLNLLLIPSIIRFNIVMIVIIISIDYVLYRYIKWNK